MRHPTDWETKRGTHRVSVEQMLRLRAAIVIERLPVKEAAKRFHVGEGTANMAALTELPKERCPGCGGMVVMPCFACALTAGVRR